ncbi:MAG: response regulator transcription factor [Leptolyngbyaceae cyanobacterium MO_188.B28]|nr:response regulator transcription factor [Leptolyngbyaceae cyanobacterium MO_188.B28]
MSLVLKREGGAETIRYSSVMKEMVFRPWPTLSSLNFHPPKIRLLLVDDEIDSRKRLAIALSREEDFQVVGQASHGREAIQLASQLQPDVILMDICMPICDGVVASRTIHQRNPWIKILALANSDEDQNIWQVLQAGALDYLLKNSPPEKIVAAIRACRHRDSPLHTTIAPTE